MGATIQYLNPQQHYTSRTYLTQWFSPHTLVVTDNDLQDQSQAQKLLDQHNSTDRILDITHNPFPDDQVRLGILPCLTNNFDRYYEPRAGHVFFPIWLWMYSLRNAQWWDVLCFDAGSKKSKEIMCLNNRRRTHRTQLWAELNRLGIIERMIYSFVGPDSPHEPYSYRYPMLLRDESEDPQRNDVGVGHAVYNQCAVNIVTETAADLSYVSEKICKAFVARQIPVIVGCVGVNKFLQDIGLDMFEDVVPWRTWDNETDQLTRVIKIAKFVDEWIRSRTILNDYNQLLPRIEKNKQYFHSEAFRTKIMAQMQVFTL